MIISFGSINYDFIFSLDKMPQVGQTLLARALHSQAGGKGANQAVAAARDGAKTIMVGAVGQDALAAQALHNLVQCGADTGHIAHLCEAPTGCASIYIDADGNNTIIVAAGANMLAKAEQVDDALLAATNLVLMPMENDPEEITKLIRRAHKMQKTTILNLAPAYPLTADILALCSLIVVNEDEAAALAGWLGCQEGVWDLATRLGTGVMRTLGARGSEVFVEGQHIKVDAFPVKAIDTTAAGDCFIGVLAASLERGGDMREAMQRASKAASLACSRSGSQTSIPHAWETDGV